MGRHSAPDAPTQVQHPGRAVVRTVVQVALGLVLAAPVLVREIGITVYRFAVVSDHVLAAAWMGKLKTVAQAVALSFALLPLWTVVGDWIFWVNGVTMTLAVVLTATTGCAAFDDPAADGVVALLLPESATARYERLDRPLFEQHLAAEDGAQIELVADVGHYLQKEQ